MATNSIIKPAEWLKLYKELQKAGRQFPQYSYKHFARRRIRDYFELYRGQQNTVENERWNELYKEGQSTLVSYFFGGVRANLTPFKITHQGLKHILMILVTIKRQATISSLFPHRPLVIEGDKKNG